MQATLLWRWQRQSAFFVNKGHGMSWLLAGGSSFGCSRSSGLGWLNIGFSRALSKASDELIEFQDFSRRLYRLDGYWCRNDSFISCRFGVDNPRNSCLPHCVLDRFGEIFYETDKKSGVEEYFGGIPKQKIYFPLTSYSNTKKRCCAQSCNPLYLKQHHRPLQEQTRYTSIQHIT